MIEVFDKLFGMFLNAAAVFAALEVLYFCLLFGGIYLIIKAFR